MKARAKKVKQQSEPKQAKVRKDPRIEEIYEEVVEFICPVRGKIKQVVKIKRFKALSDQPASNQILSNDSIAALEEQDNGLSIYSDGEELGLSNGAKEPE